MAQSWRGEINHHGALNFYPIFIPRFESQVFVSVFRGCYCANLS